MKATLSAVILAFPLLSSVQSSKPGSPSNYAAIHDEALRRAQVWVDPSTPIEKARLGENPSGRHSFGADQVVDCTFKPGGVSGTTPKFDCELPGGEKVKVKYGAHNAEVYTEVAASRLLAALGFPADQMYVVGRVRCFGCPKDPFEVLQCVNEGTRIEKCFPALNYTRPRSSRRPSSSGRLKGVASNEKERGWRGTSS